LRFFFEQRNFFLYLLTLLFPSQISEIYVSQTLQEGDLVGSLLNINWNENCVDVKSPADSTEKREFSARSLCEPIFSHHSTSTAKQASSSRSKLYAVLMMSYIAMGKHFRLLRSLVVVCIANLLSA